MDHTFSTEAIDGTEVSRISIEGELDIATVEQVEKAADAAIAARRPVVVDLAKCPFMDSTGLHWIVLVHQALTDEVGLDAPMAIVARSSGVLRLLSVTTIDERIPVFRTEDEALTALQAASSSRAVGRRADDPRPAAAGEEAERPPDEDQQAVLKPDQVPEVDEKPRDPGREPAEADDVEVGDRPGTADRREVALVAVVERPDRLPA